MIARPSAPATPAKRTLDPRLHQIAVLAGLLIHGITRLDFEIAPARAALILVSALAFQYTCTRIWRLPAFEPKSALISGLSLCLLLRTPSPMLAIAGAGIAIVSKFVLRRKGKHVFNPANLACVVLIATGHAWVSPGQWGNAAFLAFLFACLGGIVVQRARRSDVTFAFIASDAAILFGRALWLGQRLAVPLHQMESGAFLLFSFFMISDPRTTPDTRIGRIAFAALTAAGAAFVQFGLYRTNGLLWSLAACSLAVPLIDRMRPGARYEWTPKPEERAIRKEPLVRVGLVSSASLLAVLLWTPLAHAFCGFYVAAGNAKLFNQSSQVVLVRDRDRTVMTMVNDFQGEPKEFAIVVPVPTVLQKGQIHIGDKAQVDHLDAYSAPRLVEYFDQDPCRMVDEDRAMKMSAAPMARAASGVRSREEALGVTIEARYTVGEYDILILSATQSNGLETWLRENQYRIPDGASRVLGAYIKQGMKFFVARVNLKEQQKLGFSDLRPIQVAYESPRFMLPIRLGMVNANGPQELYVYALTRKGRVETSNYRTVKLPSDQDVPEYVKDVFPDFYRALFAEAVKTEGTQVVFTEYAWDMSWCDPCASPPLSREELQALGVFWLDDTQSPAGFAGGAGSVFLTRLHVRYDREHFPEDLVFQETADRTNFQGRYILHHPWKGSIDDCPAAQQYRESLRTRREQEAKNLAELTGWSMSDIRGRMNLAADWSSPEDTQKWWGRIWK
jgi:Na+-translocating ferredoxin:NAD+ oxidoreductase RnfD subunit